MGLFSFSIKPSEIYHIKCVCILFVGWLPDAEIGLNEIGILCDLVCYHRKIIRYSINLETSEKNINQIKRDGTLWQTTAME